MLKRLYDLFDEIKLFMNSKTKSTSKFDDELWLADLAFLVDMKSHLDV